MLNSNTLKLNQHNDLFYITFPSFEKAGGVHHAFSTRLGGASEGIYSTMNLSFTVGDSYNNVYENYRRICSEIKIDHKRLVFGYQVHNTNIRVVTEKDAGKGIINERDYDDFDGLVTNIPNLPLATLYADCVPLLFYDPAKKVIGSSHAGWKGTVGEIGKKTIQKMQEVYGCNPSDIIVGIAPSIGPCCYEVDEPVATQFTSLQAVNTASILRPLENGKYMLNLWETNRQVLASAGVPKENITITDICTRCNSNIFHSHRATGGKRGSLAAIIALS